MQSWTRRSAVLAVVVALIVGGISGLEAHKGATGIVKERMMSMKSMGEGLKGIAAMVTGKAPYDAAKVKAIAMEIEKHATSIPKLFPKGSIKGPSEALPAIWKNWADFESDADDLVKVAGEMAAAADASKDAAEELFGRLRKACSGCHDDYRKKKE